MRPRLLVSLVTLFLATTVPAAVASAAPAVATGGVQSITQTTATLTGAVNPRGAATKVYFRYGPTGAYGARTPDVDVGVARTRTPVSVPISGLTPGTRYHYRLVAESGGETVGLDRSFVTATTPVPPPPPAAPEPSKLQLARATIFRSASVIDILAPITGRASGNVSLNLRAAGQNHSWEAPIDASARRVRESEGIPSAQARKGTGILTINYAGDADTRPQVVRLRAANVPAALSSSRPTLMADGHLRANGTVSDAARGVVRVQLEYFSGGVTTTLEKNARIADGKWALDAPLTPEQQAAIAQRQGTVHSYVLFTGYLPAKMRGEMRSFQVLGAP